MYTFIEPTFGGGSYYYVVAQSWSRPWIMGAGTGIATIGSPFDNPGASAPPHSNNYVFMQGSTTLSANLVGMLIGTTYQFSYRYGVRQQTQNPTGCQLSVYYGSQLIYLSQPNFGAGCCWPLVTSPTFTVTQTSGILLVDSICYSGGDQSILIVDILIATISTTVIPSNVYGFNLEGDYIELITQTVAVSLSTTPYTSFAVKAERGPASYTYAAADMRLTQPVNSGLITASYSKCVWAYIASIYGFAYVNLMSSFSAAAANTAHLFFMSSAGVITIRHGSDTTGISYTIPSWSYNKWYHYCGTYYDPTYTFSIYVNGIQVTTSTASIQSPAWAGGSEITMGQNSWSYTIIGGLQCAQWYQLALSPTQVKAVYNGQIYGGCGTLNDYLRCPDDLLGQSVFYIVSSSNPSLCLGITSGQIGVAASAPNGAGSVQIKLMTCSNVPNLQWIYSVTNGILSYPNPLYGWNIYGGDPGCGGGSYLNQYTTVIAPSSQYYYSSATQQINFNAVCNNFCMTLSSVTLGATVTDQTCSGASTQQFTFIPIATCASSSSSSSSSPSSSSSSPSSSSSSPSSSSSSPSSSSSSPSSSSSSSSSCISITTPFLIANPVISNNYINQSLLFGSFNLNAIKATCTTQLISIALIGDCVTQGLRASNFPTTSFPNEIGRAFQAVCGDGGSGWQGINDWWLGPAGFQSNWGYTSAAQVGNVQVTSSGSPGISTAAGPGVVYLTGFNTGDSVTFGSVRGTNIRVYYNPQYFTYTFTIIIDGGTPITVTATGASIVAPPPAFYSVSGLPQTTHNVKITYTSGSGVLCLYGVTGENNVGVVVNNYGNAGETIESWLAQGNLGGSSGNEWDWNGGQFYPSNLFIFALGVNDANNGNNNHATSTSGWMSDVAEYINGLRSGLPTVEIMFLMPMIGSWQSSPSACIATAPQNADCLHYVEMLPVLNNYAQSIGGIWVSLTDLCGNSVATCQTLVGCPGCTPPSGYFYDQVHPNDNGHCVMAQTALAVFGLSPPCQSGYTQTLGTSPDTVSCPTISSSSSSSPSSSSSSSSIPTNTFFGATQFYPFTKDYVDSITAATMTLGFGSSGCFAFPSVPLPNGGTDTVASINEASGCGSSAYLISTIVFASTWSVVFWLNGDPANSWNGGNLMQSSSYQTSGKISYTLFLANGGSSGAVYLEGFFYSGTSTSFIPSIFYGAVNEMGWNHYALTFDGNNLLFYFNGAYVATWSDGSSTWANSGFPSTNALFFQSWQGWFYHLYYYDTAISATTVATIHTAEA
jgi:hypothetical protein